MMNTKPFLASSCLALSTLAFLPTTQAANVSFEAPAIAGSGCSFDTYSYQTKRIRNGALLTINTRGFRAKPGNVTCNLALPIRVPTGYRVSEVSGIFTGYAKGKAELRRSYFLAGATGSTAVSKWISSTGRGFTQKDSQRLNARCGEDVNLRVNSRLRTVSNTSQARISAMHITVRYVKCTR